MSQKVKVASPVLIQTMEGKKTARESGVKDDKKDQDSWSDLHWSQRNLKKIQPPGSVLQSIMLLFPLTVKVKPKLTI